VPHDDVLLTQHSTAAALWFWYFIGPSPFFGLNLAPNFLCVFQTCTTLIAQQQAY
jgi:uncharacterized membrane protein